MDNTYNPSDDHRMQDQYPEVPTSMEELERLAQSYEDRFTSLQNDHARDREHIRTLNRTLGDMQQAMQELVTQMRTNPSPHVGAGTSYGEAAPVPPTTQQHTQDISDPVRTVKPKLPDVEVFSKGTHEQYEQWKMKMRAKLYGDLAAFPTAKDQVNYIVNRTGDKAFLALASYVSDLMRPNTTTLPDTDRAWNLLDAMFIDPTARLKAFEYVRTIKQGKTEFSHHLQNFNIQLTRAGLDTASDDQKIDYLRTSLNFRLLRTIAGHQPGPLESYEDFCQRCRITWENIKSVDRIQEGKGGPIYQSTRPTSTSPSNDAMDWQPTTVSAARTREFWGTKEELDKRKVSGLCLRCGREGHRVRECKARIPGKPKSQSNMRIASTATVEDVTETENTMEAGKA